MAQRLMGIQVGTFGNHNFDSGIAHLQQMIDLAGAPTSADAPGQPFKYVAANLENLDGNLTGVDTVAYFNVGGVKVAVIGIVNEEAPTLVSRAPSGRSRSPTASRRRRSRRSRRKKAGARS